MSSKLVGRSLFVRLSIALLAALLVLGALQFIIFYRYFTRLTQESIQRANWTLAEEVGKLLKPPLQIPPDAERLEAALYELSQSHPSVDIYLIDRQGSIRGSFLEQSQLGMRSIDISPVERFLSKPPLSSLPILGDDPRKGSFTKRKPISAAAIKIGDVEGYVYVVLQGARWDLISSSLEQDYGLKTLILSLTVAIAATATSGAGLFFLLTRRFRTMQRGVERFRSGDYRVRVPEDGSDDLAEISRSFNAMAATVEEAIRKQAAIDDQRRQFVASVSHDLRSPLTYIRGNIETLILGKIPHAEQIEYLESCRRGVFSLESLIDNLFELSKLEANEAPPRMEEVPLAELVNHVIGRIGALAESRRIVIERHFSDVPAVAVGDPMMLERIFVNLLENAIKYGKAGGVVSVHLTVNAPKVICAIEDDGVGIPEDALSDLFTPFYRVESNRSRSHGSGLGLAVTKRLLEAQGSSIRVESRQGEGSTFYFELELAE